MNAIREISLTIRNAVLVAIAVILGFCAGSALGLPVWLQTFLLLPAVFLFCRLSGERRPSLRKLFGFAVLLSAFVFLVNLGSRFVPERYFWVYWILIVLVFPLGPIARWLDRRFTKGTNQSEQAGRCGDKPSN
jgi:hypothetical protein